MDIRLTAACSLALGALLTFAPAQGQQQNPSTPPGASGLPGQDPARPQGGEGAQDPEKQVPQPVQETPEQRVEKLEAEQRKLQQEIDYIRGLREQGAMAQMVRDKLAHRDLALKSIDAGSSRPPMATAQQQRARLMSDGERQQQPADVVYLVGGQPIRQQQIDELTSYLASFAPPAPDDQAAADNMKSMQSMRAVMELLRIASAQSQFADTAAELDKRMQDLRQQLENGADFADLARKNSQGPNADKGGDISPVTRNSYHGLVVERMAFATADGALSPVFSSMNGMSLLRVRKHEPGETRDKDQVQADLITIAYTPDQQLLNQAATKVMLGQVALVARDEAAMQQLPAMFRPMPAQPPANDGQQDAQKPDRAVEEHDGRTEDEKAGLKPGDVRPGEVKPAPAKSGEGKPGEVKPGEVKPAGKGGEGKQ